MLPEIILRGQLKKTSDELPLLADFDYNIFILIQLRPPHPRRGLGRIVQTSFSSAKVWTHTVSMYIMETLKK